MAVKYENYPGWMVLRANLVSLSIYMLGIYLLGRVGIIYAGLYLLYCLWVELKLFQGSCANCYYYGKWCSLGRGKLCALWFPKGNPQKFIDRKVIWRDVVPDFLVFIFPLIGGVINLFQDFSWIVVGALVALGALSFEGNALVRGMLACKHCKQRDLGCPAAQLFNQSKAK